MKNLKFKNRWYTYQKTIETQLSADYVPDWTLFHAIRESIQNMVDEKTLSGTPIAWTQEGNGVYFYDKGRGVDFEDILYLGVSGKRGLEKVVGQHGEGEVVSSLVAARLNIEKIMASKDWLVRGRLDIIGGHKILVLDLYKTDKSRKGTCWSYSEGWNAFLSAKDSFLQTKRGPRLRIRRDEPGQLYTRGMRVNTLNDLALGYDLDATPGRDRGGFTWEQIKEEVAGILEQYGKKEDFARILETAAGWWTPKEITTPLKIDEKLIRSAAKSVFPGGLSWAQEGQSAQIADAHGQGIKVITTYSRPPEWLQALPNVQESVSANVSVRKPLPALLQAAVDSFMSALGSTYDVTCTWEIAGDVRAYADGTGIVLSRKAVKSMTFQDFIGVLAHEISHIETQSVDCTRAHEAGTREVLTKLVLRMCDEDVRVEMARAEKAFKSYYKH